MARILYSIQGVGMGHAMRSQPIIEHLISEGHQILITANNKAYKFFKKNRHNVYRLKGVDFALNKQGKVEIFGTLWEYLKTLPGYSYYNIKKLIRLIEDFKPELVITDFEPFAQLVSHFYRLPLISIDNQHRITHCYVKIPPTYYDEYLEAKIVVSAFILKADYYVIVDFASGRIKKDKKKTFVVSPVIREGVRKHRPKDGDHILVYMWSKYVKNIIPVLKQIEDEKFIVYGLNKKKQDKNIIFRPFSSEGMAADLASAKAVVANAGFTLMSEALYLKKPLLVCPMAGQFEQILNGLVLEQKGYGLSAEKIDALTIEKFLANLPKFRKKIKSVKFFNNKQLFRVLDKIIKKESRNM